MHPVEVRTKEKFEYYSAAMLQFFLKIYIAPNHNSN